MRKGSYTSDARLRSFEKGMFCCKLTVASGIRKGLLHVSLGAVGSCSLVALRKSFSLSVALNELKKCLFRKTKTFPFVENFSNCT